MSPLALFDENGYTKMEAPNNCSSGKSAKVNLVPQRNSWARLTPTTRPIVTERSCVACNKRHEDPAFRSTTQRLVRTTSNPEDNVELVSFSATA